MSGGFEESGKVCFRLSDALLDTTFFIDLHRRDFGATQIWESIFSGEMTASYSAVTAFELWIGQLSSDEAAYMQTIGPREEA